jgi:D-alanyl-D-alanine dipeptidase
MHTLRSRSVPEESGWPVARCGTGVAAEPAPPGRLRRGRTALVAPVLALVLVNVTALALVACRAADRRSIADVGRPAGLEVVAPREDPLLDVERWDPRLRTRAVYATSDNFVGEVLYPVPRILLRRSLLVRLSRVADTLEAEGLGLLVYDGYRPWAVTKRMWDVVGDPRFVADPSKGSRHNRGMAVDLTLVDATGRELPMPTAFDAFLPEAAADAVVPEPARSNRERLVAAMQAEGFQVLASEWWHFDGEGWRERALLDVPLIEVPELHAREAVRSEYLALGTGAAR